MWSVFWIPMWSIYFIEKTMQWLFLKSLVHSGLKFLPKAINLWKLSMKSGCLHTFTIHHQHICAHLNKIYKDFVAVQLVCLTWSHVKDTVWQVTTVISFHATGMDIRFTREGKEIQKARNRLQLLFAVNPLNHFSSCCM